MKHSESKTVTVAVEFSAAKRLSQYQGKCGYLHGYRHKVEATFTAHEKNGIIIDFGKAQSRIENWLSENWDHTLLLNEADRKLGDLISNYTGQKIYYFDFEPTAEDLAEYLKDVIMPRIIKDAECKKIRLYDNDHAFVEVQ